MTDFTFRPYWFTFPPSITASIIITATGSTLTRPQMMAFGVPPDITNGSNRNGMFLQSLTGLRGFAKSGKLFR